MSSPQGMLPHHTLSSVGRLGRSKRERKEDSYWRQVRTLSRELHCNFNVSSRIIKASGGHKAVEESLDWLKRSVEMLARKGASHRERVAIIHCVLCGNTNKGTHLLVARFLRTQKDSVSPSMLYGTGSGISSFDAEHQKAVLASLGMPWPRGSHVFETLRMAAVIISYNYLPRQY